MRRVVRSFQRWPTPPSNRLWASFGPNSASRSFPRRSWWLQRDWRRTSFASPGMSPSCSSFPRVRLRVNPSPVCWSLDRFRHGHRLKVCSCHPATSSWTGDLKRKHAFKNGRRLATGTAAPAPLRMLSVISLTRCCTKSAACRRKVSKSGVELGLNFLVWFPMLGL